MNFSGRTQSRPVILDSLVKVHAEEVFFDFGLSEIRPEADSVLRAFYQRYQKAVRPSIYITAHTDAIGTGQANQKLSQDRAGQVKLYLDSLGVDSDKMLIRVFGEDQPVATNDTDEGRQLNRRATIALYENLRLTPIEGQIKDLETGLGIEANIVIHSKYLKDSLTTDSIGRFDAWVPDQSVVGIDVFAEGYFFETKMIKSNSLKPFPIEMGLPPVKEGATIDLKNFYFVGNQAVLLERSKPELERLLQFMNLNKTVTIEIAGHINLPNAPNCGKETWHYDLSVRRAKMVHDYLMENKVLPRRVSYKGYGNWQMKFPHAQTAREQELNRRVEIKILTTGDVISEAEEK